MATPIVMPRLGDFMMEGTVTSWAKAPGESVTQGEVIAEIETEKINYDLEATESGIFHPLVKEGATVPVDVVMGYVLAEGEGPPQPAVEQPAPGPATAQARTPAGPGPPRRAGEVVPSTPGARRLAASLGVDISKVTATGPRGRVVDSDVRAYAEQLKEAQAPRLPPGLPTPSTIVTMAGMRRSIAEHMRTSLSSSAQLSYFLEIDVTEAQRLRREFSAGSDNTVTLANVLMKACAEAVKRVPRLNSVLSGSDILYFDQVNIGVAVALDEGLIVPVVRDVGNKDVGQISKETRELTERARRNELKPDDVVGGTLTISVLGSVDGFTPILNAGQTAILGAGRTGQKPVVRDGEVVVREMMTVSLTADHQVIDGADAASFLRRFQQMMERPAQLFK